MKLSEWIELAGTLIAALGILFGGWQFYQGAQAQRDAATIELMAKQLELSIAEPEWTSDPQCEGIPQEKAWFQYHALFTARTIYNLQPDLTGWAPTLFNLICDNRDLPRNACFPRDEYSPEFIAYVDSVIDSEQCKSIWGDG